MASVATTVERLERFHSRIRDEECRNERLLHLTANEPRMSETARAFMGSRLADRYYVPGCSERGVVTFGSFTFLGMPGIEGLMLEAERAVAAMLHGEAVNLNCLSGVHAMMCAILSTTEPGDLVMTLHPDHGGHFATKGVLDRAGRRHVYAPFLLQELRIDVDALALRSAQLPKAIYLDTSCYLNPHDLEPLRAAVGDEVAIIYDASHTMGLMMGGTFQAPLLEGADVVCGNTHKTFPGPHKGLMAFRDAALGARANDIINGTLFSSTHTGAMIALGTTVLEMETYGGAYARQIIANSNALGEALHDWGFEVRRANTGRFSENHQVHVITEDVGHYLDLYERLVRSGIVVNFDSVLGKRVFLRLGTQEITRRGMAEEEMEQIAWLLQRCLLAGEDVSAGVTSLVDAYQDTYFSFDQPD